MTWEIFFAISLIVLTFVSLVIEKYSSDITALSAIAVTLLFMSIFSGSRLPSFADFTKVISNPAPLTIASMFIISAALNKSGIIEQISIFLGRFKNPGYTQIIILLVFTVGFASAFINNTPVVVMLLPILLSQARAMSIRPSKLLIPLSYASIFGGTCTLLGTSTNILASGLVQKMGYPEIGMFELTRVGLPLLLCGAVYLVVIGRHLLPDRESLSSILTEQERREFMTEVFVEKGSPLIGVNILESELYKKHKFNIIAIMRKGVPVDEVNTAVLAQGDRLVLSAPPSEFAKAHSIDGLNFTTGSKEGLSTITEHAGGIVEAILAPNSAFTGRTIKNINFMFRYQMVVLAIHRRGRNVRDRLNTLKLELGDTLLLMGSEQAIENMHGDEDLVLLDRPPLPTRKMRKKAPIVLLTLSGIVISTAFNLIPIAAAAIIGVAVIFITGCLQPKEGYQSVDWSLLVLIYGMLTLGMLLQVTGTSNLIVEAITGRIHSFIAPENQPIASLVVIYFCTFLLTEVLSNNATVVIMLPIGITLAHTIGVDPRPFIIAICVASSASFSTPIGYQTNTYVYSVGGYRFADFIKVGLPLNILYMVAACYLIPKIWHF
ncbi:MAG: SLC13 family permease [Spirochaetes bacterium]|nr:SLC13 family permease [Spirochaetota bacterium]